MRRQLLTIRKQAREDNRKQRRRSAQNGREAARNLSLAAGDHQEWEDIVQ